MSKTKRNTIKSKSKIFSLTPGITKKEKNKRAKYLSKRINVLFKDVLEWIEDLDEYSVKKTLINVDGEKLPALDILVGKKSIVSLKPAGLYAFGVNCRVDMVSGKETNILFDIAKESAEPDWQLISSKAGKKPKKFTKMVLRNLLKRLR